LFLYKKELSSLEDKAILILKELEDIINNCEVASKTAKKGFIVENFNEIVKKSWLDKESLNYRTFSRCYCEKMDELFKELKEVLKEYYEKKDQNFFLLLSEISKEFERSRKELYIAESNLSFSDVLKAVFEILSNKIDKDFLYFRLDSKIEHILLDEFQDTSLLQYEVLKPLISEITSGVGINDGSFFFVGDKKQSIYRFRGGFSKLFDVVAKEQNTTIKKLTKNYRSKKEIVEFVNDVFIDKIKDYTPQIPNQKEQGYVKVLRSDDIFEDILEIIELLIKKGAKEQNIAVLCATNKDGEEIKEFLKKYSINVITETTTKLINQDSIIAIFEYLKFQYFKKEIFLNNFFAKIKQQRVDVGFVNFHEKNLLEVVKEVINRFNMDSNDLNLLQFLEIIESYSDIEELIYDFENIEAEAISPSLSGIRILTIHKSKGLEFDNVLVVDRFSNENNSKDPIIYEYEGINLKNLYLRTSKREFFDDNYKDAIYKEKELEKEDKLYSLYVAFTRAKNNLFIIKKSQKSSFELLDLEEKEYGSLSIDEKEIENEFNEEDFEYKELFYGLQSEILNNQQNIKEDVKSQNFGLALHYALEMIEGFEVKYVEKALEYVKNKYGYLLEDDEFEDIKNRVFSTIQNKEFQRLLNNSNYYKEQGIKYKNNLYYTDLLIEKDNEYIIVDYKSTKSFHDKNLQQVKRYVKIIKELTNKQVKGYIYYILKDKLELIKV